MEGATAKHCSPQPQHQQEAVKKKIKKSAKTKQTTPLLNNEAEAEPPPMASSSAIEATTANHSTSHHKAWGLNDVLSQAAQQALNEIVIAHSNFQSEFVAQALHHNTLAMAQMLDMTAETVPCESHGLLIARDNITFGTQAPSTVQCHAATQQANRHRPPKPNAFLISRTLCAWGRHAHTRPVCLTTDASGRLSLHNIMQVWGTQAGLQPEDIVQAIHEHSASDSGPRYTTQATHSDLYIKVRPSTKHTSRINNYNAIGAPPRQKRRRDYA